MLALHLTITKFLLVKTLKKLKKEAVLNQLVAFLPFSVKMFTVEIKLQ